jgi:hypothetical protein
MTGREQRRRGVRAASSLFLERRHHQSEVTLAVANLGGERVRIARLAHAFERLIRDLTVVEHTP